MLTLVLSKVLMFLAINLHPFHVSVSEIYHNQEKHSLEITMKLFVDDFGKAISQKSNADVDLYKNYNESSVKQHIANYLKSNFMVAINQKQVKLNYLGGEIENDAIWCYLECPDVGEVDDVKITNKILLEIYDDQMNLVHFEEKDKIKSFQLYADNESGSFNTQNW